MQKQKENVFRDKFRLLDSQEHAEEIIWSLSDSSDYEDPSTYEQFTNISNKASNMKRKRKKKSLKNLSNLSITVLDTSQDRKVPERGETSPILNSKLMPCKSVCRSPILANHPRNRHTSPVLSSSRHRKSPILAIKSASPKTAGKITKKLFSKQSLEPGDNDKKNHCQIKHIYQSTTEKDEITCSDDLSFQENIAINNDMDDLPYKCNINKDTAAKLELVNKVKTFFDSHFSTESTPQNSQTISDIPTQKTSSRNSDEIEILTCKSQEKNNSTKDLSAHSSENSVFDFNINNKKARYKKDGLAHRLNKLLKKQNACLSLWQHERYLAANSNFQIPKGENTVFRIQKVHFKYGCYLLEVVDLNEDDYLVLINNCYVFDRIQNDNIIKVYYPFKVVRHKNIKVLINVCKFECIQYKM